MPAKKPPFATEAALCAAFIDAIDKRSWVAFPETGGFDILLVRKVDGFQIGVEAKLVLNLRVLTQALEEARWWETKHTGPDCSAILVPDNVPSGGLAAILPHLAVTMIVMRFGLDWRLNKRFSPELPREGDEYGAEHDRREWHELCPDVRLPLPDYVPDVVAGSSAPLQLTTWKIAAIKIAVIAERRGFVTRSDFRALKIDPRRWIDGQWLVAQPFGRSMVPAFVVGPRCPDFRRQHPKVIEQIASEINDWFPKLGLLPLDAKQPTGQGGLL